MTSMLGLHIVLGLTHNLYVYKVAPFNEQACPLKQLLERKKVFFSCLNTQHGALEFVSNIGNIISPSEIVQKRCTWEAHINDCANKYFDIAKECFHLIESDLKGLETWKTIDEEVLAYICKNNAETTLDFLKPSKQSCWDRGITRSVRDCTSDLNITAPFYNLAKVKSNCKQIEEAETCINKSITKYCPKNDADAVAPLLQIIKSNICN
ncbi:uncharacterized protein LOC114333982 isoform X2 [Diabrotica virgifera virgifera]|uniref:Uncharacterized protein n=1 Tax=Diabrotica virgifera virgifera TaxID=50390 RepID=A0ABM5K2H6_DIAVI|nr:uncharacterized protein LOC114333982 isoform X2 [Diabrotica virgifera virgifera]